MSTTAAETSSPTWGCGTPRNGSRKLSSVRERGLTQAAAGEILGLKQPDVSDLMRGKLARFSMERLERFLTALDMEVRIQVGPRPPGKARAEVTVELVPSF